MRKLICCAALAVALSSHAATTITVSNDVTVPQVKRIGISGISHYYYDRVILKNLVWHNAGFEGLSFQSMIRCPSGSTSGCLDDNPDTQWRTGFWNGATYEFVLGSAKGRTGTIGTFVTAPHDGATGSTWSFADTGTAVAAGDYFIARKYTPGGADMGWNVYTNGGATVSTELTDLPPGTQGRQCIRLSAASAGQNATINSAFGTFAGQNFVIMNGTYRVTFKAKGTGGSNAIAVMVGRGNTTVTNQVVALTPSWATYNIDFSASEPATVPAGFAALNFMAYGSAALLDEVSVVQTNGDATNTTGFRDPVVAALRSFNPGILRSHNLDLGDSPDDLIGHPFAHRRNEYSAFATDKGTVPYGWHEFLELCELIGAEPYLDIPIVFSDTEAANLIEYLADPSTSPSSPRPRTRAPSPPGTTAFPRIDLELGNEAWNSVYRGGTMLAADYGTRGNDLFRAMRRSTFYDATKLNLILGVQASNPVNSRLTHNASANHDMLALAPSMPTPITDSPTTEHS